MSQAILKIDSLNFLRRNGWGMSELVAGAIVPPPEEADQLMKMGSVGTLMAGLEVMYSLKTSPPFNKILLMCNHVYV